MIAVIIVVWTVNGVERITVFTESRSNDDCVLHYMYWLIENKLNVHVVSHHNFLSVLELIFECVRYMKPLSISLS